MRLPVALSALPNDAMVAMDATWHVHMEATNVKRRAACGEHIALVPVSTAVAYGSGHCPKCFPARNPGTPAKATGR